MVAHPVTQVIGELALEDILDLSDVAWTCWGCFYIQQWAGGEDGEGIRPAAGTGNGQEEINWLPACVWYAQVRISDRPKIEPVII